MTENELCSTCSSWQSWIAIGLSIGIPLFQYLWKTYWIKAKVKFHHDGQATLFFNKSGAYIRINGVIESERKSVVIKKVNLKLTHDKTNKELNLTWFRFISPVTQTMFGNNFQQASTLSQETAHPIRVEANSIACTFIEFGDYSQTSFIKIQKICSKLEQSLFKQNLKPSFKDTFNSISTDPIYLDSTHKISEEYYWNLGTYSVDITIEYDNKKQEQFSYTFEINNYELEQLNSNIDEILTITLKDFYKEPLAFQTPVVTLTDKK